MIDTNLFFIHWCINWSYGETTINHLAILKQTVLNRPSISGDQLIISYKFNTILYMVYPDDKFNDRKFIKLVKFI